MEKKIILLFFIFVTNKIISKEIKVDITLYINEKLSVKNRNGTNLTNIVLNHGRYNSSDLGNQGSKIGEEFVINGAPIGSIINFEIKGEGRSRAMLVHQDFNNIGIENGNSYDVLEKKYHSVVLPHEYLLNIHGGTDNIIPSAELSYSGGTEFIGDKSAKSRNFNIIDSTIKLRLDSNLQGFSENKYPGLFYNRSVFVITIIQP